MSSVVCREQQSARAYQVLTAEDQAAQFVAKSSTKALTISIGAPGRTRTSTMLPPPDFESGASTNSATGACRRS